MTRGRKRMRLNTGFTLVIALLSAASLLSACGGGGGGGGGAAALPPAGGPSRPTATAFSSGTFLGGGSVIVNGVEFSTPPGTTIRIDDANAAETAIRIGMIVKVLGTFGPNAFVGTAASVDVEPQLIGPVAAPGGTANFTILGQSVTTDSLTIFDGVSRTPAAGTQLEVHGIFTGANTIQATYVRVGTAAKVQIRGILSRAPVDAIGSQQVNITGLTPVPVDGDFVEVEGDPVLVGGVIQANKVEIENVALEAAGREIEVEGTVVAAPVGNTFTLRTASGLVPVSFNTLTTRFELEENNTVTNSGILTPGAHVEVEGNMVGGTLQATEIELERRENVVLQGNVQGLSGTTFTLSPFNFSINFAGALVTGGTVANGAHVEVGGNVTPPGTPGSIAVTRVTVIPLGTRLAIQGPVANVNATDNTFTILGVAISLTGLQERDNAALGLASDFQNAANVRIDRGNFMALLQNNISVVKTKAEPDALNPPFNAGANTFNPRAGAELEEHR